MGVTMHTPKESPLPRTDLETTHTTVKVSHRPPVVTVAIAMLLKASLPSLLASPVPSLPLQHHHRGGNTVKRKWVLSAWDSERRKKTCWKTLQSFTAGWA